MPMTLLITKEHITQLEVFSIKVINMTEQYANQDNLLLTMWKSE